VLVRSLFIPLCPPSWTIPSSRIARRQYALFFFLNVASRASVDSHLSCVFVILLFWAPSLPNNIHCNVHVLPTQFFFSTELSAACFSPKVFVPLPASLLNRAPSDPLSFSLFTLGMEAAFLSRGETFEGISPDSPPLS